MGIICQRIMLLAFLFLIQANFLALAQPICIDNGNYTGNNSTYRANLNTVLSTLSTNLNSNGFTNASVGQSPDRANAIILCRGDLQLDECRSCLQDAADKLLKGCPDQKQAIMWETQGNCMLRYSNETFIGSPLNTPSLSLLYTNSANVSSPEEFKEVLRRVIDILRGQAANGGPLRKVAAANVSGPDSMFIYSFVQCTPDLSKEDCSGCLITAAGEIPSCCGGKRGAALLFPSCILRFEQAFTFYNDTRLQELATSSPLLLPSPGKADGNTSKTSIIIVVSIVGPLITLAVVVVILLMRKRIKWRNRKEELIESDAVDDISTIESLQYALSTIKLATNDFSDDNKLGQGGFGPVYKGRLSSGLEIAVKRLSVNSGQGILEFKNEVLLLSRLQHRNLVKLLGFCLEETEKLLVYEFVPNASLDFFIFDRNRSNLDWEKGYNIIRGIVRGILYLHEDSQLRIIHRDLKASNVLLDGDMNPKIADFGIARLFGQDETQGRGNTKRIVGTYGYMAPEYAARGHFSIKSDVFSFGVIVLEIISGRKNYSPQNGQHLLSFAWKNWHEGTPTNIVDPLLISGSGSMNDILRCIHIGLLCVQVNAADRPTMASVVLMLSSFTVTLAVPSKPAFYIYDSHVAEIREYNSRDIENNSSPISCHSSNDASITDLYPR